MDPLYSYSRNREGCKLKKICVETLSTGAHCQTIDLEERPRDSRSAAHLGGTYERQTLSSYFSKKNPTHSRRAGLESKPILEAWKRRCRVPKITTLKQRFFWWQKVISVITNVGNSSEFQGQRDPKANKTQWFDLKRTPRLNEKNRNIHRVFICVWRYINSFLLKDKWRGLPRLCHADA